MTWVLWPERHRLDALVMTDVVAVLALTETLSARLIGSVEGDPAIKGKIKQIRQERMRRRMMAAVPNASVVITNPTHYAVALQYDSSMNAPVCVAKGIDNIARKIREVALAHNIPVVENPPLARLLHASVNIDAEIAPEHYKAVAEVIGYVMRLRRTMARSN
jgi:flagellar biosynthesis protein FlhB